MSTSPTRRLHSPAQWMRWIGRSAKRLAVLVVGFVVLGAGIAMLALPGPGLLVILLGLGILATEFAWAERALDRTTTRVAVAASSVSSRRSGRLALAASGGGLVLGGALVAVLTDGHRLMGATVMVAGLVGLATLLPPVQRWIEAKSASRHESA